MLDSLVRSSCVQKLTGYTQFSGVIAITLKGYGAGNPQLLNGSAYIYEIRGRSGLFVDIPEYEDIFRVKHYPRKVITNRRNLRRWMRKDYFKLTKEQLDKVSEFFEKYPDGVITFG